MGPTARRPGIGFPRCRRSSRGGLRTAIASRPSPNGRIRSKVHSGRLWSRCSDISALTVRHRSARVTHSGLINRRTWSRMSKSAASIQRGQVPEASIRSVARGWLGSRCATAVRRASRSNGDVPGARTMSFSVWPVIAADSSASMCASSTESRSGSSPAIAPVYESQRAWTGRFRVFTACRRQNHCRRPKVVAQDRGEPLAGVVAFVAIGGRFRHVGGGSSCECRWMSSEARLDDIMILTVSLEASVVSMRRDGVAESCDLFAADGCGNVRECGGRTVKMPRGHHFSSARVRHGAK